MISFPIESFYTAIDVLRPILERSFSIPVTAQAKDISNSEIRAGLISRLSPTAKSGSWGKGLERWEETGVTYYPSFLFEGNSSAFIVFNPHSIDLCADQDIPWTIACHELLHEVFNTKFKLNPLNFIAYPLLTEGFSEYGSMDIFSHASPQEELFLGRRKEKMMTKTEDYQRATARRKLTKRGFADDFLRFTSYDAHTLGYAYYKQHLGRNAHVEELTNFARNFQQTSDIELTKRVKNFLEQYV